jgi:hypothetical protein
MDISTGDLRFLEQARSWISERGEILALVQYSRAAGSKDFFILRSMESLRDKLGGWGPQACVTLFREPQLPLRGTADDAFVAEALRLIPDGAEYLCLSLEPEEDGSSRSRAGTSRRELGEDLEEWRGRSVAVGLYPPWLDDDGVVVAYTPDENGVVTPGVY